MSLVRRLEDRLVALYRGALRRPRLAAGLFLALGILSTFGLTHLRLDVGLVDILEPTLPSTREYAELRRQFASTEDLVVVLRPAPNASFSLAQACESGRRLQTWYFDHSADFSGTLSSLDLIVPHASASGMDFRPAVPLACDDAQSSYRLDVEGLGVPKTLLSDPSGREITFSYLPASATRAHGFRAARGNDEAVESLRRKLATVEGPPALLLGARVFEAGVFRALEKMPWLNLAYVVLLVGCFRFFFGSWTAGIAPLVLSSVAVFWVHGLMGLFGAPINMLTSSLFLMILIASIESFVFVFLSLREKGGRPLAAFRRHLLPGALTAFTTVLGFLALTVSGLQVVVQFGLWAAVGAALQWLACFLLFPVALRLFPSLGRDLVRGHRVPGQSVFERALRVTPFRAAKIAVVAVWVGLFFIHDLNFNDSPEWLFPKHHVLNRDLASLKESRGWKGSVSLVFPSAKEVPQGILAEVRARKWAVEVEDPWTFESAWRAKGVNEEQREEILARLRQNPGWRRLGAASGDARRAIVYLAETDAASLGRVTAELREICGRPETCYPAGELASFAEFTSEVPSTLVNTFGLSVLLVLLLICGVAWSLGKTRAIPALALSLVWGEGTLLLLMAALQVQIGFVSALFAAISVGLTGDSAVHFLCDRRGGLARSVETRGLGAILVLLTMGLGAVLFVGSDFASVQGLGFLMLAGFALTLLGDIWVLKGLLPETERA